MNGRQQAHERALARTKLAVRMEECVGRAPMTFLADPAVPLLTAELLLRDLEELGWTPPATKETDP